MKFDPINPVPGLYDMTHNEYHSLVVHGHTVMGRSILLKHNDCPASVRLKEDQTPAMLRGQAFHSFILDGFEAFFKEFIVLPEIPCPEGQNKKGWKNTNEYKGQMKDIMTANEGKAVIPNDMWEIIINGQIAIDNHPFARHLISHIKTKEQSAIWQDEETGIWCKARPDMSAPESQVLVDVKMLKSVSEYAVNNDIRSYGIDIQAAMSADAYKFVTGQEIDTFLLITVCPTPPYRVEVYELDSEWLTRGRSEYHRLLRIEKSCREADSWPNYQNAGNQVLVIPGYLKTWEER